MRGIGLYTDCGERQAPVAHRALSICAGSSRLHAFLWAIAMAIVKCPECANGISDKAAACPHCGYPIAGPADYDPKAAKRAQQLLRSEPTNGTTTEPKKRGRGFVTALGVIFLIIVAAANYKPDDKDKMPSSPCKSSWWQCSDNADLINNYTGISDGKVDCEIAAKKLAKYGTPKFPWGAFGTFYTGSDYVKTGVVTLIEKDAQFSNAFNAMVHSTVICKYDLNARKVLDASVAGN